MNDCYDHTESNLFYVAENILGPEEHSTEYEQLKSNFNSQLAVRCNCTKVCSPASCKCFYKSCDENYIALTLDGELKYRLKNKSKTESPPIYECYESCSCSYNCSNRIVQKGPIVGLEIKLCAKGLGLYTKCFIAEGMFVCEYAGELITKSQAAMRHEENLRSGKMNYIFCLNEHSSESVIETFVDPSVFGNIGRYLNHSCEPNCYIVPVRCGSPVPKLAIFANRDIMPNEELTFHYGSNDNGDSLAASSRIRCLCKSDICSGFLPFHKY